MNGAGESTSLLPKSHDDGKQLKPALSTTTDQTSQSNHATLAIMSVLLLVASVFNSIFFKKMTNHMTNHPWFLSQLSTVVYIPVFFGITWLRGGITDEMRNFPKLKFFYMGAFDALSGVLSMIGAVHTSGGLQALLSNAIIPITMILSYFMLNERFNWHQIGGASLLTAAVILAVLPLFFGAPSPEGEGGGENQIVFVFLFVINNIPSAVGSVYKEIAFASIEMNENYLQAWVALFQLILGVALIPLNTMKMLGRDAVEFNDIPALLYRGFWCLMGYNMIVKPHCIDLNDLHGISPANFMENAHLMSVCDACHNAWVPVVLYLVFNMLYNWLMIVVIKHGGAALLYIIMSLRLPIVQLAFASPWVQDPPEKLTMLNAIVLTGILIGLYFYNKGGGETLATSNRLNVNWVKISNIHAEQRRLSRERQTQQIRQEWVLNAINSPALQGVSAGELRRKELEEQIKSGMLSCKNQFMDDGENEEDDSLALDMFDLDGCLANKDECGHLSTLNHGTIPNPAVSTDSYGTMTTTTSTHIVPTKTQNNNQFSPRRGSFGGAAMSASPVNGRGFTSNSIAVLKHANLKNAPHTPKFTATSNTALSVNQFSLGNTQSAHTTTLTLNNPVNPVSTTSLQTAPSPNNSFHFSSRATTSTLNNGPFSATSLGGDHPAPTSNSTTTSTTPLKSQQASTQLQYFRGKKTTIPHVQSGAGHGTSQSSSSFASLTPHLLNNTSTNKPPLLSAPALQNSLSNTANTTDLTRTIPGSPSVGHFKDLSRPTSTTMLSYSSSTSIPSDSQQSPAFSALNTPNLHSVGMNINNVPPKNGPSIVAGSPIDLPPTQMPPPAVVVSSTSSGGVGISSSRLHAKPQPVTTTSLYQRTILLNVQQGSTQSQQQSSPHSEHNVPTSAIKFGLNNAILETIQTFQPETPIDDIDHENNNHNSTENATEICINTAQVTAALSYYPSENSRIKADGVTFAPLAISSTSIHDTKGNSESDDDGLHHDSEIDITINENEDTFGVLAVRDERMMIVDDDGVMKPKKTQKRVVKNNTILTHTTLPKGSGVGGPHGNNFDLLSEQQRNHFPRTGHDYSYAFSLNNEHPVGNTVSGAAQQVPMSHAKLDVGLDKSDVKIDPNTIFPMNASHTDAVHHIIPLPVSNQQKNEAALRSKRPLASVLHFNPDGSELNSAIDDTTVGSLGSYHEIHDDNDDTDNDDHDNDDDMMHVRKRQLLHSSHHNLRRNVGDGDAMSGIMSNFEYGHGGHGDHGDHDDNYNYHCPHVISKGNNINDSLTIALGDIQHHKGSVIGSNNDNNDLVNNPNNHSFGNVKISQPNNPPATAAISVNNNFSSMQRTNKFDRNIIMKNTAANLSKTLKATNISPPHQVSTDANTLNDDETSEDIGDSVLFDQYSDMHANISSNCDDNTLADTIMTSNSSDDDNSDIHELRCQNSQHNKPRNNDDHHSMISPLPNSPGLQHQQVQGSNISSARSVVLEKPRKGPQVPNANTNIMNNDMASFQRSPVKPFLLSNHNVTPHSSSTRFLPQHHISAINTNTIKSPAPIFTPSVLNSSNQDDNMTTTSISSHNNENIIILSMNNTPSTTYSTLFADQDFNYPVNINSPQSKDLNHDHIEQIRQAIEEDGYDSDMMSENDYDRVKKPVQGAALTVFDDKPMKNLNNNPANHPSQQQPQLQSLAALSQVDRIEIPHSQPQHATNPVPSDKSVGVNSVINSLGQNDGIVTQNIIPQMPLQHTDGNGITHKPTKLDDPIESSELNEIDRDEEDIDGDDDFDQRSMFNMSITDRTTVSALNTDKNLRAMLSMRTVVNDDNSEEDDGERPLISALYDTMSLQPDYGKKNPKVTQKQRQQQLQALYQTFQQSLEQKQTYTPQNDNIDQKDEKKTAEIIAVENQPVELVIENQLAPQTDIVQNNSESTQNQTIIETNKTENTKNNKKNKKGKNNKRK